jgi:hypothetical protein
MLQNRVGTSANQGQGEFVTELKCKARETATNPPGGAAAWGIRALSA